MGRVSRRFPRYYRLLIVLERGGGKGAGHRGREGDGPRSTTLLGVKNALGLTPTVAGGWQ